MSASLETLKAINEIRHLLNDVETTNDEICRMELVRRIRMKLAEIEHEGEGK